MTPDEAVVLLQARLGKRTDLAAVAMLEMQLAQLECEKEPTLPWFLEQEYTTSFTTTTDVETVSLPSTFIVESEEGGLYYQDTSITSPDQWKEVKKDGLATIRDYYRDAVTGKPEKYAKVNTTLYFRPIPDAAYALKIYGYFQDTVPSTGGATNLWLTHAPDLLIAKTGERLASRHMQNPELAKMFLSEYSLARSLLVRDTERRLHANRQYSMGDD